MIEAFLCPNSDDLGKRPGKPRRQRLADCAGGGHRAVGEGAGVSVPAAHHPTEIREARRALRAAGHQPGAAFADPKRVLRTEPAGRHRSEQVSGSPAALPDRATLRAPPRREDPAPGR